MSLAVQGSLEPPQAPGLARDEASLLRIACAQVLPSETIGLGDIDKLATYAKEAARHGADVIVFPEYFLSGATHDAWRAVQKQDAPQQNTSQTYLQHIAEFARENDIDIVAGTIVERGGDHVPHRPEEEEDDEEVGAADEGGASAEHDGKVFNTVYYVDRSGAIAGRYTKKRLWHPERAVLSPGHELRHKAPRTFEIKTRRGTVLRAGIAVCWDLAFPETFREMLNLPSDASTAQHEQLGGPDIVFAPTCWYATDSGKRGLRWNTSGEAALLDSICLTRAIENECIVAMSNIAGPPFPKNDKEIESLDESAAIGVGRSCVCAPFVGNIGRLEHGQEALLLACVDLRTLYDAREIYRQRYDLCRAWQGTA